MNMANETLLRFFFSSYPAENRDKIEQAIRDAGFQLMKHPDYDQDICVFAQSKESIRLLQMELAPLAPNIKCRGPM